MTNTIRLRLPLCAVLALVTAALAWVTPAAAGTSEQIVQECLRQGYVDPGNHSRSELQRALNGLPSDISEYTDCYDVIADALDAKRRKRGGGANGATGGAGGAGPDDRRSTPSSAQEVAEQGKAHNEIESTLLRPAPNVTVGGKAVVPKIDGAETARAANDLPLPILLVIVAVAITFAGAGLLALRSKLPALRRKLGRGPAG